MRCRRARASCPRLWTSRPRPPRSCASSRAPPGDLEPVFQAMLENCRARLGVVWLREGNGFRSLALQGVPPAHLEQRRREPIIRPGPEIPIGTFARTPRTIHVADIATEPAYTERVQPFVALADICGARSLLLVPMLRQAELAGAIAIYRQEVRPFTDRQIQLAHEFRRPGGHSHRECAVVRRNRGQEPAARERQAGTSRSSSPT